MLGELFDPKAELQIAERIRPHWSQSGAVAFVTFRTQDSIPREVIQRWDREKNEWLQRRGYADSRHWSDVLSTLEEPVRREFKQHFNRTREDFLDTCLGRCLLRRPELAEIVANALLYFDGDRYQMGDFVVMPNHVHLLAAFPAADIMREQFDSWMHYSAYRVHSALNEKGKFWQQEPFDHLVRSIEQYAYLRDYIARNPTKANLRHGEYIYRRYPG